MARAKAESLRYDATRGWRFLYPPLAVAPAGNIIKGKPVMLHSSRQSINVSNVLSVIMGGGCCAT